MKNISFSDNKIYKLFKFVLYCIAIIIVIYNSLYVMNYTFKGKKYISIGKETYVVRYREDESMKPYINIDDLVIVKKISAEDIKINDVIGYDTNNQVVFHRVIDIKNNNGTYYFYTKADGYMHNDLEPKTIEQINGKITKKIPIIGKILKNFENKITLLIICIILVIRLYQYNVMNQREQRRDRQLKMIHKKNNNK